MTHTIALANLKGGSGRTTTAVSLSVGLARSGLRVLLCDLDSQGSASLSLGLSRAELTPGAAEVLVYRTLSMREAIRPTAVEGLSILTGSIELANSDLLLGPEAGRELRLRQALKAVEGDFDVVMVDTPPGFGLMVLNALVAADSLLVTLTPTFLSVEGLASLFEAIEKIAPSLPRMAELRGILITMATRTRASTEVEELLRRTYGKLVFSTTIPSTVRVSEAPEFGLSVFDHAPSSSGAQAYQELVGEVRKRLGLKSPRRGGSMVKP